MNNIQSVTHIILFSETDKTVSRLGGAALAEWQTD
jgi:hypothetical protein